jgi:hypothetical protein
LARLFAECCLQVAEHKPALGSIDSRAAHPDAGGHLLVGHSGISRQQNLRPLELAYRVLAGAEKRLEFVPFTLAEFNPIPYIHACLPIARGTDEQLNRMAFVSLPAKPFTDKQGQYLAFIYAYTRLNRRPPAEIDMQRYFKVSPPSVHQMVLTLEREGFISRQPGVARSIEMLIEPERLPVLR